jgi:hypothetical protein
VGFSRLDQIGQRPCQAEGRFAISGSSEDKPGKPRTASAGEQEQFIPRVVRDVSMKEDRDRLSGKFLAQISIRS